MSKKVNKLSDVKVNDSLLLKKGYSTEDMLGKTFIIESYVMKKGDNNSEYMSCVVSGDGLEEGKLFSTGANNIVVKVRNAGEQNLLPIQVTVTKHGNAYDIE